MSWLKKKLAVLRWLVLERISRRAVENANLKAPVQLALLVRQASLVTSDVGDAIQAVKVGANDSAADQLVGEYPSRFNINPLTESFLRSLVLEFAPRRLVETGVANGVSTRVLLEAIGNLGGHDRESHSLAPVLHSLDISPSVVTSDLSGNQSWRFHLVDELTSFEQIMRDIGEIDFFFHDSNHAYWNQLMEYRLAWQNLTPGGILVSDDINWSQAFLHFCEEKGLTPAVLCDGPKFVGVVRKFVT